MIIKVTIIVFGQLTLGAIIVSSLNPPQDEPIVLSATVPYNDEVVITWKYSLGLVYNTRTKLLERES